jgi:lipopolysaccharide transport system ATP-binding protein
MTVAIRASGVSKRYQIGAAVRYRALRDTITDAALAPARWLGNAIRGRAPQQEDNTIWSLDDVSFEIQHGDAVGIVGRNGAGKSTLMKVLSRITEPTRGEVELHGRVGTLLEVGTGFHPELTGRENVFLNGAILGMKRAEILARFDEIVAFAEIDRFIDTPVKHYSSGMYVRLAFAVAAHLEPEILLVDEVLAVGDAAFQRKCLGKMGDVAKQGRTVLFVSHSMPAIQTLCTRALLLDQGKLVLAGSTDDVVMEYLRRLTPQQAGAVTDLRDIPRDSKLETVLVDGTLQGEPLASEHVVLPKSELIFDLTLEVTRPLKQCNLGIHFENEMGLRTLTVGSRWLIGSFDLEPGVHRVRCRVPELALVPGRYYLSVGLTADGKQLDWLERVTQIEVARYDVYGTGDLPQTFEGYFLTDAEWKIEQLAAVGGPS